MAHRHRTTSKLAVATGIGMILSSVLAAAPASAAEPFTPEELSYNYPSNVTYDYTQIMDQFFDIRDNQPGVIALNDSSTVRINNTATTVESDRAIVDQYADMALSMADGLGRNLGAIYSAAWAAGELPKTQALVSKNGGLVGYYSSSNPAKEAFDYDRPYIRFKDKLVYRDKVGGDAWASTSGAFPSGHTSQAYWQGTTLATLLPELAPQILARTSEAGHNRIVMAAHYPLDVMSGRMMGQKIVERRWNDAEFRMLFDEASAELHSVLEAGCGDDLAVCIAADTPYLTEEDALAVYAERMTYDFAQTSAAGQEVTIPAGAEALLLSSHSSLTAPQRRQVLALTAIDSGFPLDEGQEGSWQRINLAAAMAAEVTVEADGTVSLVDDDVPTAPTVPPVTEPTNPTVPPVIDPTNPTDPTTVPIADPTVAPTDPTATPTATPGSGSNVPPVTGSRATESTSPRAGALASTGAESATPLAAALVLLLGGLALVVLRRRRITRP
jgi:LPXTG-motif cell wall-anchored protein